MNRGIGVADAFAAEASSKYPTLLNDFALANDNKNR
jgi:hypothetical protein